MADVQLATGAELSIHQQMIDSITGYAVIRLDANGLVASWHDGAEQVTGYRAEEARGALIDVSGLAVVDSFVARIIARLVAMIRLLGAEATIVGIQPARSWSTCWPTP